MTNQPITTPTQVRIQLIQGGTAEENPPAGRVVFTEQAEVKPDEKGAFDYLIGSSAKGDMSTTTLTAADFEYHPARVYRDRAGGTEWIGSGAPAPAANGQCRLCVAGLGCGRR